MAHETQTQKLVLSALMAGLIIIAIFFFRIPVPATQGIIHLGDGFIFLSLLMLGPRYATPVAAVGCALANILAGLTFWAPWTFFIKGGMPLIAGLFIIAMMKNHKKDSMLKPAVIKIMGMALAGIWMTGAYYVVNVLFITGSWVVSLVGVAGDIIQVSVGIAMAMALAAALRKTPAKKYFTF